LFWHATCLPKCRMGDKLTTEEALKRLESMHERVEKLRSTLKNIKITSKATFPSKDYENPEKITHTRAHPPR
jgi:hypothetical protein